MASPNHQPLKIAMPTYEYVCEKCEKEFEVFQSMKDPHLKKCLDEKCKGKVRRKIGTGAGLVFKGSGFYITDYRSDSYKAAAKKDTSPASPAPESKPAKAESKKETKTTGSSS